jgi:hypothetical protein
MEYRIVSYIQDDRKWGGIVVNADGSDRMVMCYDQEYVEDIVEYMHDLFQKYPRVKE